VPVRLPQQYAYQMPPPIVKREGRIDLVSLGFT